MSAYRLMAVDMDGTLLNDQKEITPGNLAAIRAARQKGLLFTLCTGRSLKSIQPYARQLELTEPIILYNGAMLCRPGSDQVLYHQPLSFCDALEILRLGEKYGTTLCIWSNNQLYGNVFNQRLLRYKTLSGVEPLLMADPHLLAQQGITKILWYDDKEKLRRIQEDLAGFPFSSVTFCTSSPEYLEFFNSRTSKGAAMKRLGELYHISPQEMIAVGDGFNDLSMLTQAGLGIAMKNAQEGVKAAAKAVTSRTNNEDGIAEILKKLIL